MDLDEIDAAGTAAMFADGAKSATLILPTGEHRSIKIFIDRDTYLAPADYDNVRAEQRLTIAAALADLPHRRPAPVDSKFIAAGKTYVVDEDDTTTLQDAIVATHIVREQ